MTKPKDHPSRLISALFNIMSGLKRNVNECCSTNSELSEKEFHVVVFIGQQGDVKMSEIAEFTDSPMSTVTSIVDKLVEKKYLDLFHSKTDKRVVLVSLIDEGQALYASFMSQKQQISSTILKEFSTDEHEQLLDFMERMAKGFQKKQ